MPKVRGIRGRVVFILTWGAALDFSGKEGFKYPKNLYKNYLIFKNKYSREPEDHAIQYKATAAIIIYTRIDMCQGKEWSVKDNKHVYIEIHRTPSCNVHLRPLTSKSPTNRVAVQLFVVKEVLRIRNVHTFTTTGRSNMFTMMLRNKSQSRPFVPNSDEVELKETKTGLHLVEFG